MLKVHQVNSKEREVSHDWTFLSMKCFLAKVFPRSFSQNFLKQFEKQHKV